MASVLNRSTKQYLPSVNTPEYSDVEWVINPDVSAVIAHPNRYWKIIGDAVTLMSAPEQAAVDAADLGARRDSTVVVFDSVEETFRAFCLVLLDELNLHAARVTAILDAVDGASNLANLKTAVAAINDVPQRTITQLKNAIRGKLGS